jgi:hypothetical protein
MTDAINKFYTLQLPSDKVKSLRDSLETIAGIKTSDAEVMRRQVTSILKADKNVIFAKKQIHNALSFICLTSEGPDDLTLLDASLKGTIHTIQLNDVYGYLKKGDISTISEKTAIPVGEVSELIEEISRYELLEEEKK